MKFNIALQVWGTIFSSFKSYNKFGAKYLNQWKPKPKAGDETALGNWNGCRVDPPDEPPIPDAFGYLIHNFH